MRVLLLNPFDAKAGSQRVGRSIAELLMSGGHQVAVRLGFGGGGFLSELLSTKTDLAIADIRFRKLLYPLWTLVVSLPVAMAALRGTLIWANTVYAAPPALLAAMLRPRCVAVHLHEATFSRAFKPVLRLMAWRGVLLVYVSEDQAKRVGLPGTILHNAVSLPSEDKPSSHSRLLFVGTTRPIKGFALFIAVCEAVRDLPLQKVAYLSDEARHDRSLTTAARSAGIDVVFGASDPGTLYRDGFLLLQASDPALCSETFSLTAAEAMAWLVPVAGAGATVLPEVLGSALAFDEPSRNPQAIATAIRTLYSDPARHQTLRTACATRRAVFSKQAFVQRLESLLKQMNESRT